MKKWLPLLAAFVLSACINQGEKYPTINLDQPTDIRPGFLKASIDYHYYIDVSSVWNDDAQKEVIYFDMVSNYNIGTKAYKEYPEAYSKSLRSHKSINCKTYEYTRLGSDVYSEFWGDGIRLTPVKEFKKSLKIRPKSTLDVVAKALCVNLYKNPVEASKPAEQQAAN